MAAFSPALSLVLQALRPSAAAQRLSSLVLNRERAADSPGSAGADETANDASDAKLYRIKVAETTNEIVHQYRRIPFELARTSRYTDEHRRPTFYLPRVARLVLTQKLKHLVLEPATGEQSQVRQLITRGLAIHPRYIDYDGCDLWLNSQTCYDQHRGHVSTDELRNICKTVRLGDGAAPPALLERCSKLKSGMGHILNGLTKNRVKFTSFSRHYTSARVLRDIAKRLQPYLQPGDTFVDFACGQNSFGALLKDPQTQQPLETVAFDILSPAEKTDNFVRRPWQSVDATTLPQGELVIGLNPPFGHENKEAIKFVQHSLCARPRLLVLIMPATNYAPPGYTLVVHDDQLCRGSVFYAPGANASNWINASATAPGFFLYRRNDPPGCLGPIHARVGRCEHVMEHLASTRTFKRKRHQRQEAMRVASRLLQPKLTPLETVGPAADKARAIAGPGQTRMLRLALGEEVLGS